jgi:hypothetical protein
VWAILKRHLNLFSILPKNLHKLWNRVQEVYATIIEDECQKLYVSMPAQIVAVWRQKKGGRIFEWFIDTIQKIESMDIPNFEMVYLIIYK